MDDELALLLGYSIFHQHHLRHFVRHYNNNDKETIPYEFSAYIEYLYSGLIDQDNYTLEKKKDELCSRMKKVYKKICRGYKAELENETKSTESLIAHYSKTVIKNSDKITEARDPDSEEDINEFILGAVAIAKNHNARNDINLEFLKSDWNKHFQYYDNALTKLKEIRNSLNTKIAAVEDVLRKKQRIKLVIISIVITVGVAIAGIYFTNFYHPINPSLNNDSGQEKKPGP